MSYSWQTDGPQGWTFYKETPQGKIGPRFLNFLNMEFFFQVFLKVHGQGRVLRQVVYKIETCFVRNKFQLLIFSILVPASVRAEPSDGNYVVKKGRRVELKCSASGNPLPEVEWTKKVKVIFVDFNLYHPSFSPFTLYSAVQLKNSRKLFPIQCCFIFPIASDPNSTRKCFIPRGELIACISQTYLHPLNLKTLT